MRTLRQGHRGPDVQRWQAFLVSQGHADFGVDGVFGPKTHQATLLFQETHALHADGVVGPKTFAKAAELGLRVLRRLRNDELSPALIAEARRILAKHHSDPFGTEVPFAVGGVHYVGRIEEHYHPPGGPRKPWGYHPGVSLFLDAIPDTQIEVADEVTGAPGTGGSGEEEAPPLASRAIIVLDPGHGGDARVGSSSANNATSPSGVLEKQLTLRMAELVREAVARKALDARVELTRTTDVNLGLAERAGVARSARADVFVSLHFNGFNGRARGVEAWIRSRAAGNVNYDQDRRLAERLAEAVYTAIHAFDPETSNRGVKESAYGVLRDDLLGNSAGPDACRACLLEIEFLDVPKVDELFNTGPRSEEVRCAVADAIATSLLEEAATT